MKESVYAPQFEKLVREADGGKSAGQLADETGSSRQTAYAWVRQNGRKLREVGKSSEGGMLYVWNEPVKGRKVVNGVREDGGVEVGSVFTVTRLRFDGGHVIATLSGAGAEVEAELT